MPSRNDQVKTETINTINNAIHSLPADVQERISLMQEGDTLARLAGKYTSILEELTGEIMEGGEPSYQLATIEDDLAEDIEELISEYNREHNIRPG